MKVYVNTYSTCSRTTCHTHRHIRGPRLPTALVLPSLVALRQFPSPQLADRMLFHVRKTRSCILASTMIFPFASLGIVRAELPDYPMTLGDMKVLAGYYTADGKYLGGLPEFHALSREIYQCTDFQYSEANSTASNATFCTAWSADESFGGGFQLGTCECKSPAPNNEFCSDWICDQGTSAHCTAVLAR